MSPRHALSAAALATALLGLAASAAGAAPEAAAPEAAAPAAVDAEAQAIFDRFDHRRHDRVFKRQDISCTACHQVGAVADARVGADVLDASFLTPPPMACHFCHNPPAGETQRGPGECETCHLSVAPPENHGAGWLSLHGQEARMGLLECDDCHKASQCVDCHERREPIRYQVHDRTWLSIHSIQARTDPTQCSTCHVQSFCLDCHTSAEGRTP